MKNAFEINIYNDRIQNLENTKINYYITFNEDVNSDLVIYRSG